jgi:hypothetical protein
MKNCLKLGLFVALALLLANQAHAQPMNEPPPAGPVILDLNGTVIPQTYQQYTAEFTATSTSTNLSFAFRDDPAFLFLANVSVTNFTTGNLTNLVSNGDFSQGIVGNSAPVGWTYLNTFGATFGGVVADNNPYTGPGNTGSPNNYYDGAVQAYDAITQAITTTVGDLYQVSFYLDENSGQTYFSSVSTNGDTTDTGGNGIDLLVYAGAIPVAAVPEPSSLVYAIGIPAIGILILAAGRRRRRAKV